MTLTKSLPLKQLIILLLKVEGNKSRSCSDKIGASKRGLVQEWVNVENGDIHHKNQFINLDTVTGLESRR